MASYINPHTGATIGYLETSGTTVEPFNVPMMWQSSTLSYVSLLSDASGNLQVTGGGGGGGNAAAGPTGSPVPGSADYLGINVGGNLVGVSATNPVPVTGAVSATVASAANAPGAVSVGVTSTSLLASNASRKGVIVVNTSSNTVSLAVGAAAVLNSGITLTPYGTFSMDAYDFSTAAINAIASAAASNVAIQEWQ